MLLRTNNPDCPEVNASISEVMRAIVIDHSITQNSISVYALAGWLPSIKEIHIASGDYDGFDCLTITFLSGEKTDLFHTHCEEYLYRFVCTSKKTKHREC